MRKLVWLMTIAVLPGVALAQWDDEPKRRRSSDGESAAVIPLGIMAPVEGEEEEWDEPKTRSPDRTRRSTVRDEDEPKPTTPWTDAREREGIVVIEDDASTSNVVIFGEDDPDRIGRSLGASDSTGMSLGRRRRDEPTTFRIRADGLESESARAVPTQGTREAPMGIVAPLDRPARDVPAPKGSDPWRDETPTPPSRDRAGRSAQPSLLDDLGSMGGSTRTFSSGDFETRKPTASPETPSVAPPRPVWDEPSSRTSGVDASWRSEPVSSPPPPPRPVEETITTLDAAPAPRPPAAEGRVGATDTSRSDRARTPSRAVRAADTSAEEPAQAPKPAEKILSYDPFAKLESELAGDEPRALDPASLPEYQLDTPKVERLQTPKYEEPEMAVRPIEVAKDERPPPRDPSLLGVFAHAGAGVYLRRDGVGDYSAALAWGLGARLQPRFLGPFSLDLSFWRAAQSEGTSFVTVDSALNHVAARAFYTLEYEGSFYVGFGAGVVLTGSASDYLTNDGNAETASASQWRPGADATALIGFRYGLFDARVDLRAVLRGGLRLDYLPALSVGIAL